MGSLIDLLKETNLNNGEIAICNYLYKYGSQPASVIAKNLNIQRSSCYLSLQKLAEQGFLEQIIQNKITYFAFVNPKLLIEQFKLKQGLLNKKLKLFQENLGSSFSNLSSFSKTKAHYFSGKSGILQILNDVLVENPKLLRAFLSQRFNDFQNTHAFDYANRRVAKQIFAQAIYPFGNQKDTWNSNVSAGRQSKYLPAVFDFGIDFLLYNQKIALISTKEEFGIIIESDSVSKAQTKLFDFAWQFAKAI